MAEGCFVVDLDRPGDPLGLEVPLGFPAVVVAVGRRGAPALPECGPDVALTALRKVPRPWVSHGDPAGAVAELVDRVRAWPGASVALVEVLRAGIGATADVGLLIESLAYSTLQAGPEFARWRASRPVRARPPGSSPTVVVERVGDVVELTLNRPEVRNAYNRQMRDELCEGLALALGHPGLSARLSAAGTSFCSGGDLDEFGTFPDPTLAHLVRTGRSPARLLSRLSSRLSAHVFGSCAGSGIELPAFAGRLVARADTRMWLPELAMGLIPGAGGTVSIPRRIGRGRTAWLGLSGQAVDAATALEWGLVDEVSGEGD